MADIDDAFVALQMLDEQGFKALRLCGAMWEEILREAIARALRAEHLMWQIYERASDEGVAFDFAGAAAEWDATHERRPHVLLPQFEAFVAARSERLYEMRVRLRSSYDGQMRAMLRLRMERARAEAVRNALLAGIAWLEAPGIARGHRH